MNLSPIYDYLNKSQAILNKLADELFVMDILNKLNAEAYVKIVAFYNELFKKFLIMEKLNGWLDNLSRIKILKASLIGLDKRSAQFDTVLELQGEMTMEWQEYVNKKVATTKVTENLFKAGYIQGSKIATGRLNITESFRLRALPLTDAFVARKKILDEAMSDGMIKSVNNTIADLYANKGMHPDAIAKLIKNKVPETYKNRARTIARTETNFAASHAQYDTYKRNGITRKELLVESDACPICVEAQISMENSNIDKTAMDSFGQFVMYPPFHPNSYSKDTEIYTEFGWINIADVKIGDLCLSYSPHERDLSYIKVIKTYKHKVKRMIHFYKSLYDDAIDLLVTEDHNMCWWDWDEIFHFRKAIELFNSRDGALCSKVEKFSAISKWQPFLSELKLIKKEIVNYNDYAYCVDIEKNHTLWVRRNGKTCWSGNCRCAIVPLVDVSGLEDITVMEKI